MIVATSRATNTISGSVWTNEGFILANANVTNKSTGFTVQTDEDGRFEIPYNSPSDILRFSHVGFDYDEIAVADFNSYFELYPASDMLEEITITNDYKKDNTALWIIGLLFAGAVTFAATRKSKPGVKKVKA